MDLRVRERQGRNARLTEPVFGAREHTGVVADAMKNAGNGKTAPQDGSPPTILYVDCQPRIERERRRLEGMRRYAAGRGWRVETLKHTDGGPHAEPCRVGRFAPPAQRRVRRQRRLRVHRRGRPGEGRTRLSAHGDARWRRRHGAAHAAGQGHRAEGLVGCARP